MGVIMQNLKPYRALLAYLVFPNRAYTLFFLGLTLTTTAVSAFLYFKGMNKALIGGWGFLTLCFALALFVVPYQARTLLVSRAFLLTATGPKLLLQVLALVGAAWVLCVGVVIANTTEWPLVSTLLIAWSGISILIVGTMLYPQFFLFLCSGLVWGVLYAYDSWKFEPYLGTATLWSAAVLSVLAACYSWLAIYRKVLHQPLARFTMWDQTGMNGGVKNFSFSRIHLSHKPFSNYLKLAYLANRPLLTLACYNIGLLIVWTLGAGVLQWVKGNSFLFWLSYESTGGLFYMGFLFVPAIMAVSVGQTSTRRLRSLWLTLSLDREDLVRYMECSFLSVWCVLFLPLALLITVAGAFDLIPVVKAWILFVGAMAFTGVSFYWFTFTYGHDANWITFVNLALIPAFSGLFASLSVANEGLQSWVVGVVSVSFVITLLIRHRMYARWTTIDFTQLRQVRLF